MTSALEKIDSTTVKITVTLTEEEVAPSMAHAYEHIGREVTIPGFRKGKVPAKILEQRVGKGAVIEHAVNDGVGSKPCPRMPSATSKTVSEIQSGSISSVGTWTFSSSRT